MTMREMTPRAELAPCWAGAYGTTGAIGHYRRSRDRADNHWGPWDKLGRWPGPPPCPHVFEFLLHDEGCCLGGDPRSQKSCLTWGPGSKHNPRAKGKGPWVSGEGDLAFDVSEGGGGCGLDFHRGGACGCR